MIMWELVFRCTNTMTYIEPATHKMINLESTVVDGWVSPNSVYQTHNNFVKIFTNQNFVYSSSLLVIIMIIVEPKVHRNNNYLHFSQIYSHSLLKNGH